MIKSAEEFRRLRLSDDTGEQRRAGVEEADEAVWLEAIARYPDLREWVAYNKTVSLSVLRLLSEDDDPRVRDCVARRRKLDRQMFERLAADREPDVRTSIATNPKAPLDILAQLSNDHNPWVAQVAKECLEQPDKD